MRTIFRIAKFELSSLFYSPVGWSIVILFIIQGALVFGYFLILYAGDQEAGWGMRYLTFSIFVHNEEGNSLILVLRQNLFLYIPLLTMGLISRESGSGSIRLLQSSPISSAEIVLGKFSAMMGLGIILMTLLGLFIVAGAFSIQSMDTALLLSGIAGLYGLLITYSAIGLYLSSLTAYSAVAAISTLAVLGALNYMGQVGQKIGWVRNITYYLRLPERVNQFSDGLISSANIFYFLIVILFFLGLTLLRLEGSRTPGFRAKKVKHLLLLTAGCLLIGYCSSRPQWTYYLDMTADKRLTLTKNTQGILRKIHAPLRIHTYINILDGTRGLALPQYQNEDGGFWEHYRRFRPDLKIDYTYYYDSVYGERLDRTYPGLSLREIAIKYASMFSVDPTILLPPDEIKKRMDLRLERGQFIRQLEAGGKTTYLRVYNDLPVQPSEAEIAASLKRLTLSSPKIAFLTGHYERRFDREGGKNYRSMAARPDERHALINQGFDVESISLDRGKIPRNLAALVIADPITAFTSEELEKIKWYIADGGNLLVAGEPGRQAILNPLLKFIGVSLMEGTLLSENNGFAPDMVFARFNKDTVSYAPIISHIRNPLKAIVSLPGAVGLKYDAIAAFDITPVIETDEKRTWNRLGSVNTDTDTIKYDPSLGDKKESHPVLLALTRNINHRCQRILIAGDADFLSEVEWNRKSPVNIVNDQLAMELFGWLTDNVFPVDVSRIGPTDTAILISYKDAIGIRIFFLLMLPGFLLVVGATVLLCRQNR